MMVKIKKTNAVKRLAIVASSHLRTIKHILNKIQLIQSGIVHQNKDVKGFHLKYLFYTILISIPVGLSKTLHQSTRF